MDKLIKQFTGSLLKAADSSGLEIVFARENVVDLDGDRFMPGSYFASHENVFMSEWGHQFRNRPVATGPIRRESDGSMVYTPKWLPGSEVAQAMFDDPDFKEAVEFSYAFIPLEYTMVHREDGMYGADIFKAQVYEVSPVNLGASIDTGVKSWVSDHESGLQVPNPSRAEQRILTQLQQLEKVVT